MVNWFSSKDIKIKPVIYLNNLHGYVLPHAGTTYTGDILSHTLQFEPLKDFDTIIQYLQRVDLTEDQQVSISDVWHTWERFPFF